MIQRYPRAFQCQYQTRKSYYPTSMSQPRHIVSIRHNVAELSIPIARPLEHLYVLAHMRAGYVGALLAVVGAEGVHSVLAKEPHGVAQKFVGGVVVEG